MASTGEPFGLFWSDENGDRTYDANSFEYWLKKFFTSGVFNGNLQVQATSGMTLQVGSGYANVDGKVKFWDEDFTITLDAANSTYPRIDTIVITRDNVNREIRCEKVTGAYSADTPQPTAPIRNLEEYQLVLAQIYVSAGATGITQSNITDTRPDPELCGYITGTVTEMDFSQFTAQFNTYISEFESENLAEFEAWFQHMKDQLDTDAAGHLQGEIDVINDELDTMNDNKLDKFDADSSGWDTEPTQNSTKAITSGGVAQAIGQIQRSYVGMVIHSTTLDTMAKVKAFYGGTTWIQHSGYVLRGATSGVVANSAVKTGGADSITLTVNQMPAHTHQIALDTASGHYLPQWSTTPGGLKVGEGTGERGNGVFSDYGTAASTTSSPLRSTGGGQSVSIVPNYKSVYIWERTV